jgi:hypothetical protein
MRRDQRYGDLLAGNPAKDPQKEFRRVRLVNKDLDAHARRGAAAPRLCPRPPHQPGSAVWVPHLEVPARVGVEHSFLRKVGLGGGQHALLERKLQVAGWRVHPNDRLNPASVERKGCRPTAVGDEACPAEPCCTVHCSHTHFQCHSGDCRTSASRSSGTTTTTTAAARSRSIYRI